MDLRSHSLAIEDLKKKLEINDRSMADSFRADAELQNRRKDLSTLQERIKEYEKLIGVTESDAALLEDYKALSAKRISLLGYQEYLRNMLMAVTTFGESIGESKPPNIPSSLASDEDLIWAHTQSGSSLATVREHLSMVEQSLNADLTKINERISVFTPIFDAKEREYKAASEKAEDTKELKAKHEQLLKSQADTKKKIEDCKTRTAELSKIRSDRAKLLDLFDKAHDSLYSARKTIFDKLTANSRGRLKLELTHGGNRSTFETELDGLCSGTGLRKLDYKAVAQSMTPRRFVDAVLSRDLKTIYQDSGITEHSATKMIDKLHSYDSSATTLQLEHRGYPDDSPAIFYKEEGGDYSLIQECSVGQKCTALVIIALSEGERPVVIDQPEDALDITTVWEDVSRTLRRHKDERQFILTTHNASVAVSSDSDMFIVVKANAKRGNVKCLGAIDNPDVKKHVVQLLEGGTDPYRLRKDKYNLSA